MKEHLLGRITSILIIRETQIILIHVDTIVNNTFLLSKLIMNTDMYNI